MDQCVSVMAREGCALLIDCEEPLKKDTCTKAIPFGDPRWAVVVTDSGVRHELAGGEYNKRRATCKAVVEKLKVKSLRYVSMETLEQGE